MKNVKKILAVCLVALFAVGVLAACGQKGGDTPAPAGSGAASGNVNAPKHYIIATDTVFAPFEFDDENGNFVGIDLDLLAAIAEDQGFTYDLQRVGWDSAIAMCQAGQADGMIAGASITEDQLVCVFNSFLHGLGKSKSDVFIKRYYFQKSVAEISSEYGIGENHVRSILSKTRKKLKKYIEEDRSWKK